MPTDEELRYEGWFSRDAYERYQRMGRMQRFLIEGNFHGFGMHICRLDPYDMQHDGGGLHVPNRVHLITPWGQLIVALDWQSRTQAWFPWKVNNRWAEGGKSHYSNLWWPVVWQPAPPKSSRQGRDERKLKLND